jgi:hypothetical protein
VLRPNGSFAGELVHPSISAVSRCDEDRRAEYLRDLAVARLEGVRVDPQGHRGICVAEAPELLDIGNRRSGDRGGR